LNRSISTADRTRSFLIVRPASGMPGLSGVRCEGGNREDGKVGLVVERRDKRREDALVTERRRNGMGHPDVMRPLTIRPRVARGTSGFRLLRHNRFHYEGDTRIFLDRHTRDFRNAQGR
jgi:hypothetical protein